MSFRLFCLMSLIAVLPPTACLAQLGLSQPQIEMGNVSAPTYSIDGVVINSVTGEPVRSALVQIYNPQQASLLTGPDGKFHFGSVPQSQLTITVRKPGFFSEQEISQGSITNQPIQVGPGMKPVTVKLIP